jgi:hypothetical protein
MVASSQHVQFFLLIFLLFALRTKGEDCSNPLGAAYGITLNTSPGSASGSCAENYLNSSSCCSADHHDSEEDYLLNLYAKYENSASYFPAIVDYIDELLEAIYEASDRKLSDAGLESVLSEDSAESGYDEEINTITTAEWKEAKENFPEYMRACHQRLFDMATAFQCMACDPNYASYIATLDDDVYIKLTSDSCDLLTSDCEDMAIILEYMTYKITAGANTILNTETELGNSDFLYNQVDFGEDYKASYEGTDEYEVIDLEYKTTFLNCWMNSDSIAEPDFAEDQTGILGPSVYNLMLNVENMYLLVEEAIKWTNDEDSVIRSYRRRLEPNDAQRRLLAWVRDIFNGRSQRRLKNMENTFYVKFENDDSAKDIFTIAEEIGISPEVEKLSARLLLRGLPLVAWLLFLWGHQ